MQMFKIIWESLYEAFTGNEIQVAIGMPAGQAYVSFILTYFKSALWSPWLIIFFWKPC